MRLLVLGGWGQLGSELAGVAKGRHELIRPPRADVDITDRRAVERVVEEVRPHAVIDAAAFHKVEECEERPDAAFAVNAVGAWNVGRASDRVGARCMFVSSDYVFDGEEARGYGEDNPVNPLNVYGVSKAAGEWLVRLACPDSLVVRGSSLFGHAGSSGKGGNFVEAMLAKAAAGEPVSVVDDVVMAPTWARDMAERMLLLLEHDASPGVYHAANSGSCSWFEFARGIFDLSGTEVALSARASEDGPVRRPRFSVLLDTKSEGLGIPPSRPWPEALAWYLEARGSLSRRPTERIEEGRAR